MLESPYSLIHMATKPPKEKPVEDTRVVGLVAYTDGGARGGPNGSNPGYAGYGLHAYTYNYALNKKGLGLGGIIPTKDGYVASGQKDEDSDCAAQVKPIKYLESHTTIPGINSNVVAEITAATQTLTYAYTTLLPAYPETFKEVTVIADYDGLINAGNGLLERWKANRWTKADGSPVQGKAYWQALDGAIQNLQQSGVMVNFRWVKGHSGDTGNEAADRMATLAVNKNRDGIESSGVVEKEVGGYWSSRIDLDGLLRQRTVYFVTDKATQSPGRYYMGNFGKEQDMEGVRNPQGYYSIVQLNTPDPLLETLIARQNEVTYPAVRVVLAYMERLYSRSTAKEIMEHGGITLYPTSKNNRSLVDLGDETVTYDCNPPYKAWSAIESLNELKALYDRVISDRAGLMVEDITDHLFVKNDKDKLELKKDFTSGYCELVYTPKDPEGLTAKAVHLVMGVDLPIRNALKKMEDQLPKVELISWVEGLNVWRYATFVTTTSGHAIFCAVHSNKVLLKSKK